MTDDLTIGELFAGYGGLGMGVQAALGGGRVAWYSEIDRGACRILEHHHPDVPNVGDITAVDWSTVEPVDVLTGGFPCQDVSAAGKRAGLKPGTRSGLWSHLAYAINQLRPPLVVIENVRGLLSAEAHSDLEPCTWCMGGREDRTYLRALGAVLGDLAELGYDAEWYGLPASDVGAPHGRFRVFVTAHPRGSGLEWWSAQRGRTPEHLAGHGARGVRLMPTPRAGDGEKGGPNQHGSSGDLMLPSAVTRLLPTPVVNDMGEGKTVEQWDEWTNKLKAEHGNGNGHGDSLAIEVARLLPTPTTCDANASGGGYDGQSNVTLTDATVRQPGRWGEYADAVERWESLTRPAPDPTEPGPKGSPRLSARFSEWMMGLPDGHVTHPAIWEGMTNKRGRVLTGQALESAARNAQLKACGNGVVPQQAEAALRVIGSAAS